MRSDHDRLRGTRIDCGERLLNEITPQFYSEKETAAVKKQYRGFML